MSLSIINIPLGHVVIVCMVSRLHSKCKAFTKQTILMVYIAHSVYTCQINPKFKFVLQLLIDSCNVQSTAILLTEGNILKLSLLESKSGSYNTTYLKFQDQ